MVLGPYFFEAIAMSYLSLIAIVLLPIVIIIHSKIRTGIFCWLWAIFTTIIALIIYKNTADDHFFDWSNNKKMLVSSSFRVLSIYVLYRSYRFFTRKMAKKTTQEKSAA